MEYTHTLRRDLLKKYGERTPTAFYQLDGFTAAGMPYDKDDIYAGETYELMNGANVRVLVRADTTHEQATKLLGEIVHFLGESTEHFAEFVARVKEESAIHETTIEAERRVKHEIGQAILLALNSEPIERVQRVAMRCLANEPIPEDDVPF